MPNLKASIVGLRKQRKQAAYNKGVRSRIRTALRKLVLLLKDKQKPTIEQLATIRKRLSLFYKLSDKATRKGVIKKNTVARHKSALAKHVQKVELAVMPNSTS